MAAEYGSGQQLHHHQLSAARPQRSRGAAASDDDHHTLHQQHQQHYMEDPDLDVSSIVTEFVPLEDPFVPYFDATGEEMESELCAPLEASFASSIGDASAGMYARFRPGPPGYPPNTSTPRFSEERIEVVRNCQTSPQRLEDALADLMDGVGARSPLQLVEQCSSSARLFTEPPPQLTLLEQFRAQISRLVSDAAYARTTNCFKSKIPKEVPEDTLISFLTHCVRYPMRRPWNTLLTSSRVSTLVLEQVLKTTMDPTAEPYDASATRDNYFRVTMKNTVNSLGQLYQIIRGISLAHRGFVDVNYSAVRGRVAFVGYNGNLPIRMSQPIGAFIAAEEEARTHLSALFSTEITLSRCGDDAREVYITYFDNIETHPRTGVQQRVTEVNVYHIIHPSPPSTSSPSAPAPISHHYQQQQYHQQQQLQYSSSSSQYHHNSPPPHPPLSSSSSSSIYSPPLHSSSSAMTSTSSAAATMMTTSRHSFNTASPPPALASLPPMRGGNGRVVSFPPGGPHYQHEVYVEKPMVALSHMQEPTYTLAECLQLARAYPQHKW